MYHLIVDARRALQILLRGPHPAFNGILERSRTSRSIGNATDVRVEGIEASVSATADRDQAAAIGEDACAAGTYGTSPLTADYEALMQRETPLHPAFPQRSNATADLDNGCGSCEAQDHAHNTSLTEGEREQAVQAEILAAAANNRPVDIDDLVDRALVADCSYHFNGFSSVDFTSGRPRIITASDGIKQCAAILLNAELLVKFQRAIKAFRVLERESMQLHQRQ